jgi:hypothetical protein
MKILVFLSTLLLSLGAFAGPYQSNHFGGCSPEVKTTNVNKVEAVLNSMLNQPEFASAQTFRAAVTEIQNNPETDQRIEAYFNIVGAKTDDQVAEFLGGDNNEFYIENARQNMKLNQEQAKLVVDEVTKALRGNLR